MASQIRNKKESTRLEEFRVKIGESQAFIHIIQFAFTIRQMIKYQ